MKKYLFYLLLLAIAVVTSGCSGGGNSVYSADSNDSNETSVNIGETIFVNPGDSIVADTNETEVVISHYLNKTKSVLVLKGSVTLLKGNYTLQQN
jgi:hypothetical protein